MHQRAGLFFSVLFTVLNLLIVAPGYGQAERVQQSRQFYNQAIAAFKNKDYPTSLAKMEEALRLRPNHPGMIYDLACVNAQAGNQETALALLRQIAEMGIYFRAAADPDLVALNSLDEFQTILKKMDENRNPVAKSERVFALSERDLLTEGVAYDPVTDTFWVGSVHHRKIVAVKNGRAADFTSAGDGLWGVFGMKVDEPGRRLWVCTSSVPQMSGFSNDSAGRAAVFQYDLSNGKLVKKYFPPDSSGAHLFGDLTLHSGGDVFVSDSRSGAIYRIAHQSDRMEVFVAPGPFAALQGLAFSNDGNWLFAADYSQGVFKIDRRTKSISQVVAPKNLTSLGIDGLYFYRGSLLAIQNGISPHRLVRFWLNDDLSQIVRAQILDANHPDFDEPTLGVIVGEAFYYVARSQWGQFDEEGKIKAPEKLQEPVILKTELQ